MSSYIPPKLRESVAERAHYCCEDCQIPERFTFFKFHLDHIIGLKHGGETTLENLANSCSVCNENKGSDIATYVGVPEHIVRFYNPRKDVWTEHFKLDKPGSIIRTASSSGVSCWKRGGSFRIKASPWVEAFLNARRWLEGSLISLPKIQN